MFKDPFLEYDKRLDKGEVAEVCIDSKQQEIELSELNDRNLSDEPSMDKEDTFIIPNEEDLSISDIEGEGDLYKGPTVESLGLDGEPIMEENSKGEIVEVPKGGKNSKGEIIYNSKGDVLYNSKGEIISNSKGEHYNSKGEIVSNSKGQNSANISEISYPDDEHCTRK